jgi:hypothetical protein
MSSLLPCYSITPFGARVREVIGIGRPHCHDLCIEDKAWQGNERHRRQGKEETRNSKTRQSKTTHGKARHGKAKQDKATQNNTRQHKNNTRQHKAVAL